MPRFLFRWSARYRVTAPAETSDQRRKPAPAMIAFRFGSPTITVDWDSTIISRSGSERYLTNDGEVAAPGFEAVGAVATLVLVGVVLRMKRRED